MITQNSVNAMARFKPTKEFSARRRVSSIMGNVITCQRDDVRLKPIGRLDSAFYLFATGERTVVNIRKMHHSKAIERLW
jgi:hypothetical protein